MATHSSILSWEISWTEEPDRLQSMELQSQIRLSNETTAAAILPGIRTNAYFPLSALVYIVNSVFFFFLLFSDFSF